MRLVPLTEAERARVTAAVTAAEAGTDGEIVTIVTDTSDRYQDVPHQYGFLAALLVGAVVSLDPAAVPFMSDGWTAPDSRHVVLGVLVLQALAYLGVRYAVAIGRVRLALTPRATRRRRVRRRATMLFRVAAEQRTEARVGVLLYLSTAERMAEIIVDSGLLAEVKADEWGEAMAGLIAEVRHGRVADGMVAAIGHIGQVLARHRPRTAGDVNELPDRLIQL